MEKQTIETLSKKVDKILFHLESDSSTNTKGLVESHHLLVYRVSTLEDDKKKIKAKVSLIAAASGFIIILIKELWSKIIPN